LIKTQNNIEPLRNIIIITLISFYVVIVVISAWLSDDAYITFRTIDNFINGFGLTWNVSERVQVYTHPLWMFIISAFYFITREIYFTSITISILISIGTVLLLFYKLSNSITNTILLSLILIFSKAFIDYSTSGLENPLTHLLIVVFFILYFKDKGKGNKLFNLSLIASLAVLNRMDIILIFLPALLVIYFRGNKWKGLLIVIAGFSPFILWEIFSLFYYGFLFPNTAYAKLNTGVSQIELIQQGFHYFLFLFYLDPLTHIVLLAGIIIPLVSKNKILLPLTIGISCYMIYLLNIGGDFMGGRFFSAPLFCSAIVISKTNFKSFRFRHTQIALILIVIILGLLSPKPTIFSTANYGLGPKIFKAFRFGPYIVNMYHGITDQRMWYYEFTGLLNNVFERNIYKYPLIQYAQKLKKSGTRVLTKDIIGMLGYYSGSNMHIIDPRALSDPLLSKLPSTEFWRGGHKPRAGEKKWLIGHFTRKIPKGYLETITTGGNKLQDMYLRKYYDKISLVTRGNLFNFSRLIEIWNLNTGKYDYLVKTYNNISLQNSN
jgi:arabinofuranosyltransferase